MCMTVQAALMAPAADIGWIVAGGVAVIVAVTPLAVLVWLARPRRRRPKR
jgi:hypothetical protein